MTPAHGGAPRVTAAMVAGREADPTVGAGPRDARPAPTAPPPRPVHIEERP